MRKDAEANVYAFGPFTLEVDQRRLFRDGELVPLLGKAFDTLVLLVEGHGLLQRQNDLIDRLWPDVLVQPNNLQQSVSLVRRALGDAEGVAIETLRGQGYRLHADVRLLGPEATRRGAHDAPAPSATPSLEDAPSAEDVLTPPVVPSRLQRVHFCAAPDGTRLAYARSGAGAPLLKVAHWLSHLELDWSSPLWSHWLTRISRDRTLVRYDARGNGLSDRQPPSLRFDDFVSDLGAVIDAAGLAKAPLLGVSQGAAVAVAYATAHPERVSGLILVGGCARGWRTKQHAKLRARMEALMELMRQGWGADHAAFRQIFTTSFFPEANHEQAAWFNEMQRRTTTPDNAADLLSALGDVDVRAQLPLVRVPTLVVHSRGDAIVPVKDGMELAAGIRGARFVELESDNHLLLEGETAWRRFEHELDDFLRESNL